MFSKDCDIICCCLTDKATTFKAKPVQTLSEAIQDVVNDVTRELTHQQDISRRNSALDEPQVCIREAL